MSRTISNMYYISIIIDKDYSFAKSYLITRLQSKKEKATDRRIVKPMFAILKDSQHGDLTLISSLIYLVHYISPILLIKKGLSICQLNDIICGAITHSRQPKPYLNKSLLVDSAQMQVIP